TLTVHSDGSYSYAPDSAAINALTAATTDVFNVKVSDGSLSAATTLPVNIPGANDAPTITAEIATPTLTDTSASDTFSAVTGQLEGRESVVSGKRLSLQSGRTTEKRKGGKNPGGKKWQRWVELRGRQMYAPEAQ